ncbi:MAG TPA: hypothetical protein VGL34_28545 [Steroidobacteraceae bacterium]|jgi:hypothetical protein
MPRRLFDLEKLHHPNDRDEFRREAARLKMAGLNPSQIAWALRITQNVARELLSEHGSHLELKSLGRGRRDPDADLDEPPPRPGRPRKVQPAPGDAQE